MINEYEYYCPKCNVKLSKQKKINFLIKRDNNQEAIILLEPKPGSYKYECLPEFNFSEKEIIDFYCPECNANLKSDKYSRFIEITLQVSPKVTMDVFFSRVHGVHKTFVGIEDFENEYGDKISKL